MHKFGCTEEMLQTRLFRKMEEKQKSHENLVHTKIERTENNSTEINEVFNDNKLFEETNRSQSEQLKKLTSKITNLEKRLNDRRK